MVKTKSSQPKSGKLNEPQKDLASPSSNTTAKQSPTNNVSHQSEITEQSNGTNNVVSQSTSQNVSETAKQKSPKIYYPQLPKATDRAGLFRLLSYAYNVNTAYHSGKMKDGFITVVRLEDDCKISYSLNNTENDTASRITVSVREFLKQDTRIKICEYLFPEQQITEDNQVKPESYIMPDRFDERQSEAICFDKGYHLVLAPAGCGKTDILAERVRRAIYNGVNVDDMLCLTFTNRASRGMRSRVQIIIGNKANDLFIGNTHRFCSKFVYDNNIVSQSSAIMDEDDMLSVINGLSDYVIEDKEDKIDAASLDFDDRKRFNAVIQVQHLMVQYRLGHPKSVTLSQESDFVDNEKTVRFYSPQQFASLCREAGLSVSIASLLLYTIILKRI